jgi:small subunit ribosomal protein S6
LENLSAPGMRSPRRALQQLYQREERMNTYELTIILRNKDVERQIERVKEILTKHGTTFLSDNSLGIRKFAYEIDRESEGYYLFMNVEILSDSVRKIMSEFKLNNNILRYLFVKIKKAATA